MNQPLSYRLARLAFIGAALIVLTAGFAPLVFARISNPPSSSASITAIGPTGQTSDGPTTTFATSTTGTDFTITGSGDTITFNLPTASAANRGLLSTANWTTFNAKESALTFTYPLQRTADTISTAFGTTTANTFSLLNIFNGNASSTQFSTTLFNAGGSATTTVGANGRINAAGASTTPQRDIAYNTAACVEANLTDGATVTWNLALNSCARIVQGGNRTLDITNETQAIGQAVRLTVCSDGTGRTMTWDSAIMWPAQTAPTQTATANRCDVVSGFVGNATGTTKVFLGASLGF